MAAGAGLVRTCNVTCICLRTLKRWRREFKAAGNGIDRRKGSSRQVAHRLSAEECKRILLTCNEPKYELARIANPNRWSKSIRCWKQPDLVWINEPLATQQTRLQVALAKEA